MATQYVFAIGKMIAAPPPVVTVDSRLAELLTWRRETGNELPMAADLILWLEDRGFVVDLLSGCTERLEPLQAYIDEATAEEAADTDDYEWDIDDRNIWRRGGW